MTQTSCPHLLVHVLVEEVAHRHVRVAHAAGRGGADRVEVPDHVVQLEQQRAVALHRHAVGHGVDDHRVRLEGAPILVGAR